MPQNFKEIIKFNPHAKIELFGQESNDETYAAFLVNLIMFTASMRWEYF
jgi:type I restriction-modification system DNA methylase subunit